MKRISIEQIKNKLAKMDLFLVDENLDVSICSGKFSVYDSEGYYYETWWSSILKGCKPSKFHKTNPYVIQNINNFLKLYRNGEYICLDQKYNGNTAPLLFKHVTCGMVFKSSFVAIKGKLCKNGETYYKHCPICYTYRLESKHATVLKQIFIHEYPDTITEDKSCVNPSTNHVLPTDIVNHRLRIAIEIQSDFHDQDDQKIIDKIKQNYWISHGYNFYNPDIRNYKVLEMIQLFFPHIQSIPDYVDLHLSDRLNRKMIQDALNDGKTITEVAHMFNVKTYRIHNMLYSSGSIYLPKKSKNKALNVKGLVHLSKNGDFIKKYDHLNDVSKDGYALGTIQRVLRKQQDFAYDSYWVYEEDYISGEYEIPTILPDKYMIPICRTNIKTGELKNYANIYDASEDLNVHPCEIYRIIRGERKSLLGYKFA